MTDTQIPESPKTRKERLYDAAAETNAALAARGRFNVRCVVLGNKLAIVPITPLTTRD